MDSKKSQVVDTRPSFQDIPQFTRSANYAVDIPWSHLEAHIAWCLKDGFDLDPDFQRGYVWKPEQKSRYIEFILRGGGSGKDIQTNHTHWNKLGKFKNSSFVLVDGKQRMEAVLGFLRDEVTAFGYKRSEYRGVLSIFTASFRWHVNDLETREEVLQWYLDLNSGGTVHTDDELNKVKDLIEAERRKRSDGRTNP